VTKLATGFPGSPINGVPPMIPMATGTSGFDCHPPQHEFAGLFDRGLDVVFLAGRNAAAGENQVMGAGDLLQTLRQCGAIVAQNTEIADLATKPRQHSPSA